MANIFLKRLVPKVCFHLEDMLAGRNRTQSPHGEGGREPGRYADTMQDCTPMTLNQGLNVNPCCAVCQDQTVDDRCSTGSSTVEMVLQRNVKLPDPRPRHSWSLPSQTTGASTTRLSNCPPAAHDTKQLHWGPGRPETGLHVARQGAPVGTKVASERAMQRMSMRSCNVLYSCRS